jgi:regulator of protease activity HflC (stomatin/prohibitin superfamily)
MGTFNAMVWTALFLYTAAKLVRCARMVPTQSAYIVERLGRYHKTLGPGFHVLIPFLDEVRYVQDLKEESMDVPPQLCFTTDNVQVEVDGILYMSVVNPVAASYGITDFRFGAIQLAQTTTRAVIGTLELDRTFEERELISAKVVQVLAEVSQGWGIQVHRYEVKNIAPPASVRDAMERQMGAERDRRALMAKAEGDKRARINGSEGKKQEAINRSEGEMQRRINEAQGRAQETLAIARATAESIEKMGAALSLPGGVEAVNLRLGQQYVQKLGALGAPQHQVLITADLANVDSVLGAMALTGETPPRTGG